MKNKQRYEIRVEKPKMKGGEEMKENIINKCLMIASVILVGASSVFAVGGVLPDGQGTNQSYGVLNMRDQATQNADGAGITNITAANITPAGTLPQLDGAALTALDAGNITAATVLTAVDGSAVTNIGAANITPAGTLPQLDGSALTALDAANITAGTVASAFDGSAITNLSATTLTNSIVDGNGIADFTFNGTAEASVVVEAEDSTITVGASGIKVGTIGFANMTADLQGQVLTTNATEQAKAGALTLNGGLTVGGNMFLTPSGEQAIAGDAAIAASAAIVKVAGDGAAVTATIADGTTEGQTLLIRGMHADNTVNLTNTVPNFMLGVGDVIALTWDGSAWLEQYRRDN